MNEQQLQAIKERVLKATQGKWFIDADGDITSADGNHIAFSKLGIFHTPVISWDGVEDKIFVSNAVNDVQALVAEVERLRKALEFYAKRENYEFFSFEEGACTITEDGGEIARQALEVSE